LNPLVLLPGMNCTADLWTDAFFRDAHHGAVITPELREVSIAAQVDALLRDLPDKFVLAGLSLGGIVAMALVQAAPERVSGLCVVSTNAKAATTAQQHGWEDWIRRLDNGESARDVQKSILPVLLSERSRHRLVLENRVLAMAQRTGAERLRSQLHMQKTRVDLVAGLADVDVPTLVISGTEDGLCPPSYHAEIAAAVPRAELISIQAGHLLSMERPEKFRGIVRFWRSRHRI